MTRNDFILRNPSNPGEWAHFAVNTTDKVQVRRRSAGGKIEAYNYSKASARNLYRGLSGRGWRDPVELNREALRAEDARDDVVVLAREVAP